MEAFYNRFSRKGFINIIYNKLIKILASLITIESINGRSKCIYGKRQRI